MAKRIHWRRLSVSVAVFFAAAAGVFFGVRAAVRALSAPATDAAVFLGAAVDAAVLPCGGDVISWDGAMLIRFSDDGTAAWEVGVDMPSARVAASDTLIALFSDDEIRLYDAAGKLLSTKSGIPGISQVRLSDKMIATLSEESPPSIRVLDRDLQNTYSWVEESRQVMDFGLTPDDLLWINTLDTGGSVPESSVGVHQPSKLAHRGDAVPVEPDDLIYRVIPTKGTLWAVSALNLYGYPIADLLAKPQTTLVYGWQLLDGFAPYAADTLGFIRAEAIDQGGFSTIWIHPMTSGSSELYLPATAISAVCDGKTLAILTRTSVHTLSMSGTALDQVTLDAPVDRVICTVPGKGFVYTSDGKLRMLKAITP